MPEVEVTGSKCEEKLETKLKLEMEKTEQLFIRLNLKDKLKQKMKSSDVLQISAPLIDYHKRCKEKGVIETFLLQLLMMDYRARYISTKEEECDLNNTSSCEAKEKWNLLFSKNTSSEKEHKHPVHPMDVQMAVFHCSDNFLKQLIVTKLSQCQYALPLLVPNPFTREIEFPLWTFRQIKKSWKCPDQHGKISYKTKPICEAKTPMVVFFRLGSISSSKSHLMNSLINERHNTFFHRDCPGSSKNRLLMDGVVEIAWYCPSGNNTDHFTDCVAFCNLHGDALTNKEQLEILTEMSTVNVVFVTDPKEKANKEILQKLFKSPKSLIWLSEDDSGVTGTKNRKYKIGLKGRNRSSVCSDLKKTIKECISQSSTTFRLEDVSRINVIRNDENDSECKTGKEAALHIKKYLDCKDVCILKEQHLPCQGKLWYDWCKLNKELYQLQGNYLEMQKSRKLNEMKQIREQQHRGGLLDLMNQFISTLNSLESNDRSYFLKWVAIFLDNLTSDEVSSLRNEYYDKWVTVNEMRKNHDKSEKMNNEQELIINEEELKKISKQLDAAMFGLEHMLREMGQIYESFVSVQKERKEFKNLSSLPSLAAEIIESGFPMELMDGDAAHVPLIWVEAVLDELNKKMENKRVFVMSILGFQSSGKSTLLNAMFGLQFIVGAGRCTRGAFMQLVKLSQEMKTELKFDYILVVDTEGLRALELAGESTHHDNELATFVVGLGNLTLINIFGENPAEMQDILQIVLQAFLRMKKVRLNPSCIFVHQNVGDIKAEEKNMEGRRRLQKTLDKMAKLAGIEEGSNVEYFSDVIAFDVQTDVHYFAQLWEGSPPMAPLNPSYSRNVQELKEYIFKKAKMSQDMTLSQFKTSIGDLWNALLNENFVFSFKNTLEIAVYRKLETEFGKWTWSLRSAMLEIEENMINRAENRKLERVQETDLHRDIKKTIEEVRQSMKQYFEEDKYKEILVQWQSRFENKIQQNLEDLVKDAKRKLNEVIEQRKARETFDSKKTEYDQKLFNLSKTLALNRKKETEEEVLRKEFNKVWDKWVTKFTQDTPSEKTFNSWEDAIQIISAGNGQAFVKERCSKGEYKIINRLGNYSHYVILNKQGQKFTEESYPTQEANLNLEKTMDKNKARRLVQKFWNAVNSGFGESKKDLSTEDNHFVRNVAIDMIRDTETLINSIKFEKLGYKDSFIQEITNRVKRKIEQYQEINKTFRFRKEFLVDLCLHVCDLAHCRFTELHKKFRDANDPRVYLEKQKPQYYNVFTNYCRGATTTAVFGELICNSLASSILEAVYNKTAIDLASQIRSDMPEFNGNRSNLEKHILKSLAEEENFDEYMEYIHNPQKHFKHFITKTFTTEYNSQNTKILDIFKRNLKDKEQTLINAAHIATEEIKKCCGDVNMWLKSFFRSLTDEFNVKEVNCVDYKEITDFDFLKQVVTDGIRNMILKQDNSFSSAADIKMEMFRNKPDDILIEHLCQCCWVQCPFCNAICTNTMENHDGDHSVPFHRIHGIAGWHSRNMTELDADFCTTAVQSDKVFYPSSDTDESVPFKHYRTAGGNYANWSITPDNSELQYWKWFVCRFQEDLEKYYKKAFSGTGEIPTEWSKYTKDQAIKCLDEYF